MNDVLEVLLSMRSGQVAADISSKFDEVIKAVLDTSGKGELTIKLFVSPSKMGMGGCVLEVEASHECKLKKPELGIGKSVFFVSKDGRLTREPPDQVGLFAAAEEVKKETKR